MSASTQTPRERYRQQVREEVKEKAWQQIMRLRRLGAVPQCDRQADGHERTGAVPVLRQPRRADHRTHPGRVPLARRRLHRRPRLHGGSGRRPGSRRARPGTAPLGPGAPAPLLPRVRHPGPRVSRAAGHHHDRLGDDVRPAGRLRRGRAAARPGPSGPRLRGPPGRRSQGVGRGPPGRPAIEPSPGPGVLDPPARRALPGVGGPLHRHGPRPRPAVRVRAGQLDHAADRTVSAR